VSGPVEFPVATLSERREILAEWAEWLESGRFVKGTGRLHRHVPDGRDKFCVLGVLCEVLVSRGVLERATRREGSWIGYYMPRPDVPGVRSPVEFWSLPDGAEYYLGWDDQDGEVPGTEGKTWPEWNDENGESFQDAAKLVRALLGD
jgi:hypothetical protein